VQQYFPSGCGYLQIPDVSRLYRVYKFPPHSVSSLRQRLGRSGRRNSPSILRMLIAENELSDVVDDLMDEK
jgi:hypothetical protein